MESLEDRVQPAVVTYTPLITMDGGAGTGSLRDQVIKANQDTNTGEDIIQLQATTYVLNLQNQIAQDNHALTGDLDITNPHHELVIEGVAKGNNILTKIDARLLNDRVFHITTPGSHVTFRNLIIFGGTAVDDGSQSVNPGTTDAVGGGILSFQSDIVLDHVQLLSNKALAGPVQLVNGQFVPARSSAAAPGQDGADGLQALGGGIAVFGGSLAITNSSLVANNQALGGDGQMGGFYVGYTIQGSVAGTGGAGGVAQGGGVFARLATVQVVNNSGVFTNQAIAGNGGAGGAGTTGTEPTDLGLLFAAGGHGGAGGDAQGGGLYIQGGQVDMWMSSVWTNHAEGGAGGDGGSGQFGGAGAQGGAALGGGMWAAEADVDFSSASLSQNRAEAGAGGAGGLASHYVIAPDTWTGPNGPGGAGGDGGAARGGAFYWFSTAYDKQVQVSTCEMHDNHVVGGQGGQGGTGAFDNASGDTVDLDGGAGGQGGKASGGGMFLDGNGPNQATISATTLFQDYARAGDGGAGGSGGFATEADAGNGGYGGDGGGGRGAGVYATSLHLVIDNHSSITQCQAEGGWGGDGGTSGIPGNWPGSNSGFAGNGGHGGTSQGGGLCLSLVDLTLEFSAVLDNSAYGGTGGSGGAGEGGPGGDGGAAQGGAMLIFGNSAAVIATSLDSNTACAGNGGYGGHGIQETSAPDGGPGGRGGQAQGGGLFTTLAIVNVDSSTFSDNAVIAGTGGYGGHGSDLSDNWGGSGDHGGRGGDSQGAGAYADGEVTFTDSTISTNWVRGGQGGGGGQGGQGENDQSGGNGGDGGNGGLVQGGGIYHHGFGTLRLLNTTIAFNEVDSSLAGPAGLAAPGGASGNNGSAQDGSGGGVFSANGGGVAKNTLIADNLAHTAPDFFGNFDLTWVTHDLVGAIDNNSNLTPQNGNGSLVGTTTNPMNPMLGPLTNNGGPTWTHQLLMGSPAINAGDNAAVTVTVDQRGLPRIVGGTVDIGACEVQANENNSSLPGGSSNHGISPSHNPAAGAPGRGSVSESAALTLATHVQLAVDVVHGNFALDDAPWTAHGGHSHLHRVRTAHDASKEAQWLAAFESMLWEYTPEFA
jgi:hypothetical protein